MTDGLHPAALDALTGWQPTTSGQRALREATIGFLLARYDACRRTCLPGHLTASALVLDAEGTHTCLVHHRIVGAWLQPGGHLEDDVDLAAAALREATGLPGLVVDPVPLHLDVHQITCRGSGPTRHFDVRFLAVAEHAAPVVSDESHDVRWFPLDDLPDLFDEVRELITLGVERLRHGAPSVTGGADA